MGQRPARAAVRREPTPVLGDAWIPLLRRGLAAPRRPSARHGRWFLGPASTRLPPRAWARLDWCSVRDGELRARDLPPVGSPRYEATMSSRRSRLATLSFALALGCGGEGEAGRSSESVAAPLASSPATGAPAADLAIDVASSSVGLVASKITRSHVGGFRAFRGTLSYDVNRPEAASVELTVLTESLFMDDERLARHVKSEDFLDTARFPEATFRSVSVRPSGDLALEVTGELSLHGRTKTITFPVRVAATDAEVVANAEIAIDRRDFGVIYPGMPDDLIRDSVVLHVDLHARR